jgi:hypothetical protein
MLLDPPLENSLREEREITVYGKISSRMEDDVSCRTLCSLYIIYDVTRECVVNKERPVLRMFQNTHTHRNFDSRTFLYDDITKVKRKCCQR